MARRRLIPRSCRGRARRGTWGLLALLPACYLVDVGLEPVGDAEAGVDLDAGLGEPREDAAEEADAEGADADADAEVEDAAEEAEAADAADAADDAKPDGTDADAMQDAGDDAAGLPGEWTSFGHDLSHTRFSPHETQITPATVGALELAWWADAPGVTATPAVVDGVVYWSDWGGGAHAHEADSGDEVWSTQLVAGFTSSPCVSGDVVYLSDRKATVYALDRATGAVRWWSELDTLDLTHLWSSPVVIDDMLVIGTSADGTAKDRSPLPYSTIAEFRGAIVGLSAATGEPRWRFEATQVAGMPEDAYGPGVSVWSSAAVDRERRLMFIGTGNSYALPASPYSDALLALDYETGALAWATQFTPNDAFSNANPADGPDYDVGAAPNLFRIERDGKVVDAVGVGDKSGRYRALDRDTGAVLWERTLEPGLTIPLRKTGGVIAPAAYAKGRLYVASNVSWSASKVWALDADTGAIVWVSGRIDSVNFGAPALAGGVLFFGGSGFSTTGQAPNGLGVGHPGELRAFDAETGELLRHLPLRAGRGGGFSVADGRVFVGSGFTFYAYSDEPLTGSLEVYALP